MKKVIMGALVGCALTFGNASVAEAKKKPEMTAMELQALQSREYETTKEVLFASVVSVFQDLGYQLSNADMPSGFITASSAMKNKTSFWEAMADQRGSGNTKVTAFVETMPSGMARVRLNFQNSKITSGMWGGSSAQDKPILDPLTYKTAWDKIDEAIFVRNALNAPSAPSAPAPVATPAAAPVAAATPAKAAPAATPVQAAPAEPTAATPATGAT